MIFTCIECNNDIHELSGDLEERTCFNCLDAEETITEKNIIDYKVKFNYDNDEAELLVEIINEEQFNNDVYSVDGNQEALKEIFIDLTNKDLKGSDWIQDWLEDLIQNDDSPYKRGEN